MDINLNVNFDIKDPTLKTALKAYVMMASGLVAKGTAPEAAPAEAPAPKAEVENETPVIASDEPRAEPDEKPAPKKKAKKKTPAAEKEQAPIETAVEESVAPEENVPEEAEDATFDLEAIKQQTVGALREVANAKGMVKAQEVLASMKAESVTQLLSGSTEEEILQASQEFIEKCQLELAA